MVQHLRLKMVSSLAPIFSISGETVRLFGQVMCDLVVQGHKISALDMLVLPHLPCNVHLLVGMDVIRRLGGLSLTVERSGKVKATFGVPCATVGAAVAHPHPQQIVDQDFLATFDGVRWTVAWKWNGRGTARAEKSCVAVRGGRQHKGCL